jgi:hypothetical protein
MSNFTATLKARSLWISHYKATTSAIIKRSVEIGYDFWNVFPYFRMKLDGRRVWELAELGGVV